MFKFMCFFYYIKYVYLKQSNQYRLPEKEKTSKVDKKSSE